MKEKWKSRKFLVWAAWTLLTFGLVVAEAIAKTGLPVETALTWYGPVSLVYIGGEAYIDKVRAGNV